MIRQKIISTNHLTELGSFRTYFTGFVTSVILTLLAYLLVVHSRLSTTIIVSFIIFLALIQFLVQLVFFLHLGKETKPKWKLFVLVFMILIVAILVFGSLWIMNNLNYRMTPKQQEIYLNSQSGL